MRKVKDISGNTYQGILVKFRSGVDSTNKTTWECVCHCGESFITTGLNLKSGNTKSCGCFRNRPARKDITGKRFGRITATKIDRVIYGKVWWICQCDCGNQSSVSVSHLISSHTRSCGCLLKEASSANARKNLGKSGKDHPRWDASKTTEERENGRGEFGKIWARRVLNRDNFQCCKCWSGKKLHAHHLIAFTASKERRSDVSNGVTLCRNCHITFHKSYGYTGFSRSDLFHFIGAPEVDDFSIFGEKPSGNRGLAVDAIWRAGLKGDEIEDLKKAAWYIACEIQRLELEQANHA